MLIRLKAYGKEFEISVDKWETDDGDNTPHITVNEVEREDVDYKYVIPPVTDYYSYVHRDKCYMVEDI